MEYFQLLKKLYEKGANVKINNPEVNNGFTKELIDEKLTIPHQYNYVSTAEHRPFEKTIEYEKRELAWYFSGKRYGDFIASHAKLWSHIANSDGTNNSNYGYLVYYKVRKVDVHGEQRALPSFHWALYNLIKDKNTRKAIVTYNDGCFNFRENKDYICSQYQHFLIRNNKLICIVGLRSSDVIFGLQFDMPWWSIVQQDLYLRLKNHYPEIKMGDIIVNISSLHIYEKHYELAEKMLNDNKKFHFIELRKPLSLRKSSQQYYDEINKIIKIK